MASIGFFLHHRCQTSPCPLNVPRFKKFSPSVQHIFQNFLLQNTGTEKDNEVQIIECCGEMNFLGILASRVFLHQKATVQEAEQVMYRLTKVQ
jgi:hypothetical protein